MRIDVLDAPRQAFRYAKPVTHTVLRMDRTFLGRMVESFQVSQYVDGEPGVLMFVDDYVDCDRCRDARLRIGAEKLASYAGADGKLDYGRHSDDFWCNSCQGTGWAIEEFEDAIVRLDILTMDRQIAMITDEALLAAPTMLHGLHVTRPTDASWPADVLIRELKARLRAYIKINV